MSALIPNWLLQGVEARWAEELDNEKEGELVEDGQDGLQPGGRASNPVIPWLGPEFSCRKRLESTLGQIRSTPPKFGLIFRISDF